jgi:hypothetical protein
MNNFAKAGSAALLLLAFSSPSFAWGDTSPWATLANGTQYCSNVRSTGSTRTASVFLHNPNVTICVPNQGCASGAASITAIGQNVTGRGKTADVILSTNDLQMIERDNLAATDFIPFVAINFKSTTHNPLGRCQVN